METQNSTENNAESGGESGTESSARSAAEAQRIIRLVVDAMRLSTDPLTAASAEAVASLDLAQHAQAIHLARCVAAFTTDDALATEMAEIVGESPRFLIGKVLAVHFSPEQCTGGHAELEKMIWKRLYAGRRERTRVIEVLARRNVL